MLKRDELYSIVENISPENMDKLIQYAKGLIKEDSIASKGDFENAYRGTVRKYNKALNNLVER